MTDDYDYEYLKGLNFNEFFRSSRKLPRSNNQELKEPWQQWVYRRYLYNTIFYYASGKMINSEDRIFVRSLGKEVDYKFGVASTAELRMQIRKIRAIAGNDKSKARDSKMALHAIAAQRKNKWSSSD